MISAGNATPTSFNDPAFQSSGALSPWEGPLPSGDSSGLTGGTNALLWGQSIQAVGSTVNGFMSYMSQKKVMGIREDMAIAQYEHQDNMSELNKDMQIETLNTQEAKTAIQVEGNRKFLAAHRERRKAEGEVKVAETRKHEAQLTEKAGEVNKRALNQLFDQYAYGNPLQA